MKYPEIQILRTKLLARVESTTGNVENTSFNDDYGNTGILKRRNYRKQFYNGSSEFTHGLGLVHNFYFQNNIQGQPDIMDTRGDLAKYPYAFARRNS